MANILSGDVFAYVNASGQLSHLDGTDVIDRGTWSSVTAYSALDAVKHVGSLYVALQASTNAAPAGIKDDYWSPLVKVFSSTGTVTLVTVTADGAGISI